MPWAIAMTFSNDGAGCVYGRAVKGLGVAIEMGLVGCWDCVFAFAAFFGFLFLAVAVVHPVSLGLADDGWSLALTVPYFRIRSGHRRQSEACASSRPCFPLQLTHRRP